MKSSRKRFWEFREKIRTKQLDPHRYRELNDKREDKAEAGGPVAASGRGGAGAIGGRHADSPPVKHEFKRKKKQLLNEYRVMLRGYYFPVAMLLVYSVIGAMLAPVAPVVLRFLADHISVDKPLAEDSLFIWLNKWMGFPISRLPQTPEGALYVLVLILIATAVMAIALEWLRLLAQQRVNYYLAGSLRQRMHEHLSKLPLSMLSDYKTGGIVSRILGDTDQVVGGVQNAIVNPFNAGVRIFITLTLIVCMDWRLSVGAALFIPPVVVIHYFLFRRLRPMWRNIQDDRSMLSSRLTDMYGGIRVVRSFRRERFEYREFGAAQHTMIRKQQYTAVLGRLLNTGWMTFTPAIGIFIIWYGGLRLLRHETTLGTLVMYQALIMQLISPITQVIDSFQNLQQNLGALDRVVDVLDQKTDMPDRPGALGTAHVQAEIELRNVTFSYTKDKEKKVIDDLSLMVPAGSNVAIVGPSGSGKTTLVNLIARFFDVTDGAILLDGRDIRDYRVDAYRELFAMVLQDVYLFDGTVADNIAYGRRHATREEVMAAAKKANAHDFIMELEKGYDTPIGERGSKLSGGQKQRLSIARAILADPRILVLDEATSSLDSHSEHLIQQSLNELMRERTTLVIAHRLSTVMHADRIVVLVEGGIAESGTHEELLERHGVYYAMFTQQFERHRDPSIERLEWETVPKGQ